MSLTIQTAWSEVKPGESRVEDQGVCRGLQIAQMARAALIRSPANRAECDQWGLIYTTANWLMNIASMPAIARITRVLRLIRASLYARGLSISKFALRAAVV
jgi:hypothetical protein